MANTECFFSQLSPGGENCSDNGLCVDKTCVCDSSWSATGDFALESFDCDIHIPTIRALWGLVLVAYVASFILCSYYIFFGMIVLKRELNGAMKCCFFCGLASVCFIALACRKLSATPLPAIGEDVSVTALFSFGTTFVFWATIYLNRNITAAYISAAEKLGMSFSYVYTRLPIIVGGFSTIPMCMPLVCLVHSDRCSVYGVLHYVLVLPSLIALFIVNRYYLFTLLKNVVDAVKVNHKMMEQSSDSNFKSSLTQLLKKLKFYHGVMKVCVILCIMIASFSTWPFMLRKSSYLLPLAWLSGGISVVGGVYLITNGEQELINERIPGVTSVLTSMIGISGEKKEVSTTEQNDVISSSNL